MYVVFSTTYWREDNATAVAPGKFVSSVRTELVFPSFSLTLASRKAVKNLSVVDLTRRQGFSSSGTTFAVADVDAMTFPENNR